MSLPEQPERDPRWAHALDGLRVVAVAGRRKGEYGEITGLDSLGFHVVFDGDEEPYGQFWEEVRPA